jgi:hypothetical protein
MYMIRKDLRQLDYSAMPSNFVLVFLIAFVSLEALVSNQNENRCPVH